MERNSVVVNTYRVHSAADLSCGVISFSEIVPIMVDDEPSGVQRPPSLSGYKRLDSFNYNQASPEPTTRHSESRVSDGERRSSFTLILQHALGRRSASMSDDKSREGHPASEPIPIVDYPSKESVEIGEDLANSIPKDQRNEVDSDDDSPPTSSEPAPSLGQIGRMNTADFRLFGESGSNISSSGPDNPTSSRQNKELKPAAPFLPLSKPPTDPSAFSTAMVAPRPDMPTSMPPPIPDAAVANKDSSPHGSVITDNSVKEKLPEKSKSSPLIRPPPPPAVKRASSGSSHTPAAANARAATAATRLVKAASVKTKRSTGKDSAKSHIRKTSEDSADKMSSRKPNSGATGIGSKGCSGEGPARPHLPPPAPPLKHHYSDPSAPPTDAVVGVAVKAAALPPPLLSERPKHGSCDWNIADCKAMAEAVADVRVDRLEAGQSCPQRTASGVNRSRSDSGEVATGNVKCMLCGSILAYKIGTEPYVVVNQHIAQVHD